ncbi:MAG: hypothetical protein Q7S83_00740 [bacterium]|nr:hypothetical protein [bacterium]
MNPNSHLYMSAAVIVIAALVIFGRKIWAAAKAPFQWLDRWMKDLTNDYSGEDSDQRADVSTEPLTLARIEATMLQDELVAGRNTGRVRQYLRKKGWRLVEFKGHSGGMKFGLVVATRKRGLHGQARINVGPGKYSVWRSLASLQKVA